MVRVLTFPFIITVTLVAAVSLAQPAPAWVVVVAEPATFGIDQESASTFADLVRLELGKQAGLTVLPRSRTPPQPCGDAGCVEPELSSYAPPTCT